MTPRELWMRFQQNFLELPALGLSLDISRMKFSDGFFAEMEPRMQAAFRAMTELERGAIANPDEKRMVGHYWLRDPQLAPSAAVTSEISGNLSRMKSFAAQVHSGAIAPQRGGRFESVLIVGIGGSALGPQFVHQALSSPTDPVKPFFFDNTDPDGMERVLASVPDLGKLMTVVISKSGGTKETRNGQLVARAAYEACGLDFAKHFVAITCEGSELDKTASSEKWLARFPMWDWVGGRTSELSAVGLLPAALQGFSIDEMLRGAREMDLATRAPDTKRNPAALLALMWHHAGGGAGRKDMVVLPYRDRLELFSRYLQQLVMESLGKERDLKGQVVNQGIAVYGNKGSTDQHAYVQQLRDGLNNFFAVFIETLSSKGCRAGYPLRSGGKSVPFSAVGLEVELGIRCGDYLSGFYQGTREALYQNHRESVTLTIREVNEFAVGMLIALFERAVGYYASLVGINAYHQPGVEAGKKAATEVLKLQLEVMRVTAAAGKALTVAEIGEAMKAPERAEAIFKICEQLAANGRLSRSEEPAFQRRYGRV